MQVILPADMLSRTEGAASRMALPVNVERVTCMSARRPWTYAVAGAVVATVAIVAALAVAGDRIGLTGSDEERGSGSISASPSVADSPAPSEPSESASDPAGGSASGEPSPSGEPSSAPSSSALEPMDQLVVPAYYLGDAAAGTRLFREFQRVDAGDPLEGGLRALQDGPRDPDYRSPWRDGSFDSATFDGLGADGTVGIELGSDLTRRPAGLSRADARLAVQQVVYTMQAAVQARAGVDFYLEGRRVPTVYGVRTPPGLRNAPPLRVLSLMSITSPEEGTPVTGRFTASGVGSSFEANVPWEIRRGEQTVKSGFTTAEGWMDQLYPWRTQPIDVSHLAPGRYTFVAMTDDPSAGEAGAEGAGPDIDTRTIIVK
jgi:hypothetical protein